MEAGSEPGWRLGWDFRAEDVGLCEDPEGEAQLASVAAATHATGVS